MKSDGDSMMDEARRPGNCGEKRAEWVRPDYNKVRAGDAELGPNPNMVDGAFTNS